MKKDTILKNRYQTGAILAESAFCVVCRAYDTVLAQDVAISEYFPRNLARRAEDGIHAEAISPEFEDAFADGRDSFLREAALFFGKYDHRGIPDVKDSFSENGTAYLVTEYLPGGSLRDYLEKQPRRRVSAEAAVKLLAPVLKALSYLHSLAIVHGGICPERLVLDENGVCRLTGIGTCGLRLTEKPGEPESGYAAPEQFDRRHLCGPWTDIYAVCAVLFEMISGKSFPEMICGGKQPRRLPFYKKADPQIEQAVLQGLNRSIQQRYFYAGALAKRIRADSGEYDFSVDEIQARWGERWLATAEASPEPESFGGRWPVTRRQIAHVFSMVLCTALCCGLIAGGNILFQKMYPSQLLHTQIARENIWGETHPSETLTKSSKEYSRILKFAQKYGEPADYESGTFYYLTAEDMKKADIPENSENKFGITNATLRKLLQEILHYRLVSPASESAMINGVFLFDGEKGYLETYSDQEDTYACRTDASGGETSVSLKYDVADGRVISLGLANAPQSSCEAVLEKVLPLMIPETYLTGKEIAGLFQESSSPETAARINHAKYDLSLYENDRSGDEDEKEARWNLSIDATRAYQSMDLSAELSTPRAGNYKRGEKRYKEFLQFVKDNATEVEKENDTVIYHLTEEAVRKWNEPSNLNLLPVTDGELLDALKKKGYDCTEEQKRDKFTVEVHPYGILNTNFLKRRTYRLSETLKIEIISDILTGRIYMAPVFDEKNRFGPVAKAGVDLIGIISEDYQVSAEKDEKTFTEMLRTYREEAEAGQVPYQGGSLTDCGYVVMKGDTDDYYRFIVLRYGLPSDFMGTFYPPYFWP